MFQPPLRVVPAVLPAAPRQAVAAPPRAPLPPPPPPPPPPPRIEGPFDASQLRVVIAALTTDPTQALRFTFNKKTGAPVAHAELLKTSQAQVRKQLPQLLERPAAEQRGMETAVQQVLDTVGREWTTEAEEVEGDIQNLDAIRARKAPLKICKFLPKFQGGGLDAFRKQLLEYKPRGTDVQLELRHLMRPTGELREDALEICSAIRVLAGAPRPFGALVGALGAAGVALGAGLAARHYLRVREQDRRQEAELAKLQGPDRDLYAPARLYVFQPRPTGPAGAAFITAAYLDLGNNKWLPELGGGAGGVLKLALPPKPLANQQLALLEKVAKYGNELYFFGLNGANKPITVSVPWTNLVPSPPPVAAAAAPSGGGSTTAGGGGGGGGGGFFESLLGVAGQLVGGDGGGSSADDGDCFAILPQSAWLIPSYVSASSSDRALRLYRRGRFGFELQTLRDVPFDPRSAVATDGQDLLFGVHHEQIWRWSILAAARGGEPVMEVPNVGNRRDFGLIFVQGWLLLVGGSAGEADILAHNTMQPGTGWIRAGALQTPTSFPKLVRVGDRVYVLSGAGGIDVQRFRVDPATGNVHEATNQIAPMPVAVRSSDEVPVLTLPVFCRFRTASDAAKVRGPVPTTAEWAPTRGGGGVAVEGKSPGGGGAGATGSTLQERPVSSAAAPLATPSGGARGFVTPMGVIPWWWGS